MALSGLVNKFTFPFVYTLLTLKGSVYKTPSIKRKGEERTTKSKIIKFIKENKRVNKKNERWREKQGERKKRQIRQRMTENNKD